MTFKQDWERTESLRPIPTSAIEKMVKLAYPYKKLVSHKVIAGGCANLNVIMNLEGNEQPLILRIYLRDQAAVFREKQLSLLLKQSIPVAQTYYIGDFEAYRFAITEFIAGITLSQLLLSCEPYDMATLMHDVGMLLAKITTHTFPKAGFFDKDLNIIESTPQDDWHTYAKYCLQDQVVLAELDPDTIAKINFYLQKYKNLFQKNDEHHLVHGDFDPTNILVDWKNGTWRVTGILDWEFAHSGSVLWDVANMLRYAHHMPSTFEKSFIQGLQENGICLPNQWHSAIYMLNICSLLDCLMRGDSITQPHRCADISELIKYIVKQLDH